MSITDAKDPASWQIGFEDGIKFAITLEITRQKAYCQHLWVKHHVKPISYCTYCEMEKGNY